MRVGLLLLGVGVAALFIGVQEMRLAAVAKSEPQKIDCAALAKNGPGDNAHVVVENFALAGSYVAERASGVMKRVWIPMVPLDAAFYEEVGRALFAGNSDQPDAIQHRNIRIVLKINRQIDEAGLERLMGEESLQGIITNQIARIGKKERELLESSYPGIDFASCYLLELDRQPPGGVRLYGPLIGGALLVAGGLLSMLRSRRASNALPPLEPPPAP